MRNTVPHPVVFVLTVLLSFLTTAPGLANVADEAAGSASVTPPVTEPDPVARALARGMMQTGVLLVPESTNDRVMAFDPTTGDLVDPDFIPADPTNLSTPIHAVLSADGTLVLVSDQIDDVVQSYNVDTGAYVGVFAPAGGANTAILDNIRGIAVRQSDGHLLVSVGGGTNADAIAEFDTSGNYLGNFVANRAGWTRPSTSPLSGRTGSQEESTPTRSIASMRPAAPWPTSAPSTPSPSKLS